jgi:hypothetical protein
MRWSMKEGTGLKQIETVDCLLTRRSLNVIILFVFRGTFPSLEGLGVGFVWIYTC